MNYKENYLGQFKKKRYQKVGGNKYYSCDIRIIASCNEDPQKLMNDSKLRKDFYYRISGMVIQLPALRERKNDIEPLSLFFLSRFLKENGRSDISISPEVLNLFNNYNWMGNVRELEHVVVSCAYHMDESDNILQLTHLPNYFLKKNSSLQINSISHNSLEHTLNVVLSSVEKKYLIKILTENNWNITKSSKHLGISRQNLQYRIKKHNISLSGNQ